MSSKLITLILIFALNGSIAFAGGYVPSNMDQAQEVFIVLNGSNRNLVNDLITLLKRKNKILTKENQIRLTIMTDTSGAKAVDALITPETSSFISKKISDEVMDDVGGAIDWLQDAGEFFYDSKNKVSFLKHVDSPQVDLGGFVSKERQVNLVTVKGIGGESIEGGNIEATPGGSVYVGNDLNPDMINALAAVVGKDKVLPLDTSFSNVAHVDESFQFVPATLEKSNQCGYALAYTDYLDGLRIAIMFDYYNSTDAGRDVPDRTVTKKEYLNSIEYFTGVKADKIEFTRDAFYALISKFNSKKPLREFQAVYGYRKEDIYVHKAFGAQKRILAGLDKLKTQVAKEGCANLKTVGLPALWTFGFNSDVAFPETQDIITEERTSSLTAFTNFVVINDAIIIPDAKAPSQLLVFHSDEEFEKIGTKFKEIISTRLTDIGFKKEDIIYSDVAGSILGDGAAHCKTNVLRRRK